MTDAAMTAPNHEWARDPDERRERPGLTTSDSLRTACTGPELVRLHAVLLNPHLQAAGCREPVCGANIEHEALQIHTKTGEWWRIRNRQRHRRAAHPGCARCARRERPNRHDRVVNQDRRAAERALVRAGEGRCQQSRRAAEPVLDREHNRRAEARRTRAGEVWRETAGAGRRRTIRL